MPGICGFSEEALREFSLDIPHGGASLSGKLFTQETSMAHLAKKKTPAPKTKPVKKTSKKDTLKSKMPVMKVAIKMATRARISKPANTVKLVTSSAKLTLGSPVPDFSMPATLLGQVSAIRLKGKPYILYFYPKDDTPGCTSEACDFRNTLPAFDKMGAMVIGVSKDSMESHQKFSRKYNLTFPLASDEKSDTCERFGTWASKSMYGRTYMGIERSTFLVDNKGIIRAIWRKVSVSGHVDEVKKAIEALQ
jgi:peroxiredoxin Q/BCP